MHALTTARGRIPSATGTNRVCVYDSSVHTDDVGRCVGVLLRRWPLRGLASAPGGRHLRACVQRLVTWGQLYRRRGLLRRRRCVCVWGGERTWVVPLIAASLIFVRNSSWEIPRRSSISNDAPCTSHPLMPHAASGKTARHSQQPAGARSGMEITAATAPRANACNACVAWRSGGLTRHRHQSQGAACRCKPGREHPRNSCNGTPNGRG